MLPEPLNLYVVLIKQRAWAHKSPRSFCIAGWSDRSRDTHTTTEKTPPPLTATGVAASRGVIPLSVRFTVCAGVCRRNLKHSR